MLKNFASVIVLHLLLCNYAFAAENETKSNPKTDSEPSGKSNVESKQNKEKQEKFAAPLNEQESARTHNSWRPNLFGGHGGGSRLLPFQQYQYGQPTHLPMNRLPLLPQLPPMVSQLPLIKPIMSHLRPPSIPHPVAPLPVAPVEPVAQFKPSPPVYSPVYFPPAFSKPTVPFVEKPTFVVSQQVIHKPVVTEKIEIIRRPVISEVVEVVHKPIVSEVQQVIKHPTYIQHVVKKPVVNEIKNEIQGSPLHLPGQHYELHDKPEHVQPSVSEVIQIPHQQVSSHGSYGIETGYKPSYGVESVGIYKPSYGIESGYKPSYGVESGYKPSYGIESVYKPSYGIESGYKPSYGIESSEYKPSYSGYKPSYGVSSSGGIVGLGSSIGSGYGSGSGVESSYGSSYGTSSGYGGEYGGAEQTWVVPAPGCRSGECGPTALTNAIDPLYENVQPMNSPYAWYPSQSRDLWERNNGDELYDQGIPLNPNYYYTQLTPQMVFDEQSLAQEQQASKLNDFLTKNPNIKPVLDELQRKFIEAANAEKLTPESKERSATSDDGQSTSTEDISEEEKVKDVRNIINSADGPMLKKIEEIVKTREDKISNSIPTKLGAAPSSDPSAKASTS